MFIQVEIPAKYTIMESPQSTTIVEEGVIGSNNNDFTLFALNSLQTPWTQYDKTNKFLFVPDEDATSIPAFSAHPKMRMKSVPSRLELLERTIGYHEQNTWRRRVPSKDKIGEATQRLEKAKTHITDFYNKYVNVRQKGIKEFMDWAEQQEDIFGFENTMFLNTDNLWHNQDISYQRDNSSLFFGVDMVGINATLEDIQTTPEDFMEEVAKYDTSLQVRCKQRMLADAPYNLKTATFDPNITYPVSMKYRYRSDYLEDAANIRHPDATPVSSGRKQSYYASDYNAQYKPPLLDWESLGFPKIAQTKSQSFIRRKPMVIEQLSKFVSFTTEEGDEEAENNFKKSLLSLDEMFSLNNFVTEYDSYYGNYIPTIQENELLVGKLYVVSDFSRTYIGDVYTPIDSEEPERGVQGDKVKVENYGYSYSGYGCRILTSTTEKIINLNPQKVEPTDTESHPIEGREVYLVRKRGTGGVKPFLAEEGYPLEELKTMPSMRQIQVKTQSGAEYCSENNQNLPPTQPYSNNYIRHASILQTDPSLWMKNMRDEHALMVESEAFKRMFLVDTLTTGNNSLIKKIIILVEKLSKEIEVKTEEPYYTFMLEDIIYENLLAFKLSITRHNVNEEGAEEYSEIIGVPHSDLLGFSVYQRGNTLFSINQSSYAGCSFRIENKLCILPLTIPLEFGNDPNSSISHINPSGVAILKKIGYKDNEDMKKRVREWITPTAYGQGYAQIFHQRKGLTISDALVLPIEERKNRITAKKKFSYTVPFPSVGVIQVVDDDGNTIPLHQDVDYIQSGENGMETAGFTVGSVITYNPAQAESIQEVTDAGVKLCGKQTYMDKMWVDIVEPPHYVYKIMKTNARHLKYTRDRKQYSRGGRPQDYTIFTDVLLPWTPLVLGRLEHDSDPLPNSKFTNDEKMGTAQGCRFTQHSTGTYNYEPKSNRGQRLPDQYSLWIDGIPAEWCPETYSFYGRSYGILNWWGSLS